MGESIHKIATLVSDPGEFQSGFVAWMISTHRLLYTAVLEQTIFSLDKAKSLAEVKKQRYYVIKGLNANFKKTSLGQNSNGEARISKISRMLGSSVPWLN